MKFRTSGWLVTLLVLGSGLLPAQAPEFYPLESVKAGQSGQGKTVFEGTRVETFQVEILGVLNNVGPQQDLILARLSGDRIERTGVFAGMSGSPVYIDDKLVGAVAFSFPFAREPIAGITPIRQMVDVFKENPPARGAGAPRLNWRRLFALSDAPDLAEQFNWPAQPSHFSRSDPGAATRLSPIATPLNLSGFSPVAVETFAPYFRMLGLVPVQGLGSARLENHEDFPLEAGSTVSVQLVRGDLELSATGTVTHISGRKIYAFGHPFLSIGHTDLPLNKAAVLTVIPSVMTSEKISATTGFVGSIKQDRATGILGLTGERPRLVPVRVKLMTGRGAARDLRYEMVTDSFLTPFLMSFTVHNSIVSSERAVGGQTLQVKTTIAVRDQTDVSFENSVSTATGSSVFAALAASAPVNFLLNSGFDEVVMERIDVEIRAVEQTREAVLEKIWQDKLEVEPGQEVQLTVFLRKSNGETEVEKYPVKIPEEIEAGPLKILVSDGISLGKADSESGYDFIPKSLPQLIKAINNLKKNDRLYIRLYRDQPSAVLGGEGLSNLPPSLLALYNSRKTSGDVQPINQVVYLEHELPATEFVLSGRQETTINIK